MTVELSDLLTDEFEVSVPPTSSAPALRTALSRHPTVLGLRDRIAQGGLAWDLVTRFVDREILTGLRASETLPHTSALCAVAVLASWIPTSAAGGFLRELEQADARELRLPTLVARECLRGRLAGLSERSFNCAA